MDEGELNQTLAEVSGEGLWVDNDDGTQDFVVEDSASNNTIVIAEDMTEGEVDDFMEEMMTAQEAGDYCPCPGTQDGHAGFYISPDGMVQYFSQKDFNAIFNEMGSDEEGGEEDEDALSKDDGDADEQDAMEEEAAADGADGAGDAGRDLDGDEGAEESDDSEGVEEIDEFVMTIEGEACWIDNGDDTCQFVCKKSETGDSGDPGATSGIVVIAENVPADEAAHYLEIQNEAASNHMLCPIPGSEYGPAGLYICPDGHIQFFDKQGVKQYEKHMKSVMQDVVKRREADAAQEIAAQNPNRRRFRRRQSIALEPVWENAAMSPEAAHHTGSIEQTEGAEE